MPGIKLIEGMRGEGDPSSALVAGDYCRDIPSSAWIACRSKPESGEDSRARSWRNAQNVGPVLEMVTEKYLLREEKEWVARQEALSIFDEVASALERGDIHALGTATTRNFSGPIQTIIPAATNAFTESLIAATRDEFGSDFWGFWMLGGMSGGGMGFIVAPNRKTDALQFLKAEMSRLRGKFKHCLPFAMEPVVYEFGINSHGTTAELLSSHDALLPRGYYALLAPRWLREDPRAVTAAKRAELDRVGQAARRGTDLAGLVESLFERMLPSTVAPSDGRSEGLSGIWRRMGSIRAARAHRDNLRRGLIGLAQNWLPASTVVEDVPARGYGRQAWC